MVDRAKIQAALEDPAFRQWTSPDDVPELNRPRQRPNHLPGEGRTAAVMLLLFPVESKPVHLNAADVHWFGTELASKDLGLVLTERPKTLSQHGGQISLPGGRQDAGESLEQTALRETQEEIGIAPAAIEVLGRLNPVYIPPSDFTMHPFVGWHEPIPRFSRSTEEVESILVSTLSRLTQPTTLQAGTVFSGQRRYENVPHFRLGNHRVWGATALAIRELLARLRLK